ncbi:MAG: hypothetical protein M1830_007171 [Pleopsidium flavum]|nr:MAG: hypothetical protein M1830_007171 [Pleopsidium flavum]
MPLFNIRELVQFPQGENSTDVLINHVHFNRTALNFFNYTLYDNGTLSNGSSCYLTFDAYQPSMLWNGTFINGTSCYDPYYGIKKRGSLGVAFACLFAASIMFTLVNLRKHGRLFLPSEKRFRAVGRRWQWYWLTFVATCGIISGVTSVDVDRNYLQNLAIVLNTFFYYLMMPGLLAAVWEAVRHWGSWQERQTCDRDPFLLPQDDRRGKKEFFMPLVFYMFAWLNFFMTIPRPWVNIEYQRSPQQQNDYAKPSGTDARFKAGAFLAFLAWCMICYSLQHSIHYYKPRNRGLWNSFIGFLHWAPAKFLLIIPLTAVRVGYDIASSFEWSISPLKYDVNAGWMYGLGYAPAFLVILLVDIWGYFDPNEDRELLRLRAERGRTIDAELGLNQKPTWWSKLHGDNHLSAESRLKAMTTEIGGGRATQRNLERTIELGTMPAARPREEHEDPFSDEAAEEPPKGRPTTTLSSDDGESRRTSVRTMSSTTSRPQQVRSMLDI